MTPVVLNPFGRHLDRVEVDMVLDVPMGDGATYARGVVVESDVSFFVVEFTTLWPGRRERYDQGKLGVVLVADG